MTKKLDRSLQMAMLYKSQGLEYHCLSQQWDQLRIQNGLLWHHYAQLNHSQDRLQLVVPKKLRQQIVEELHREWEVAILVMRKL